MTVELRPLSAGDLERRRPRLVAAFADDLVEHSGVGRAEAEAESVRQLDAMLPEGVETPGQLLRVAIEDGEEVGFIWIAAAGLSHPDMAWIGVIEVPPEHRSRGIGSRMMLAAEADLRRRGTSRLGLHVFGHNTGAQRLYTRLGYGILNQIWQRPTTASAGLRRDPGATGTLPGGATSRRPAEAGAVSADGMPGGSAEGGGMPGGPGSRGAGAPPGRAPGAAEPEVELRTVPAEVAAALVDGLVATDPAGVARDAEATIERARRYVREIAPNGLEADDMLIRAAYSGGRRVGWIWFGMPKPHHPGLGMVNYLEVRPGERRRGVGRAMVAAAAAELGRRGVAYIGLNVPGTRPAALAFAASAGLGFEMISQQMVKKL
jgi:ribosomal protein S18 acetylase RimI-like enzyme